MNTMGKESCASCSSCALERTVSSGIGESLRPMDDDGRSGSGNPTARRPRGDHWHTGREPAARVSDPTPPNGRSARIRANA